MVAKDLVWAIAI